MENRNHFESSAVVRLLHHTGLNAPLPLKADTGNDAQTAQTAMLQGDGSVEMNGQRYANIDVAMGATSEPWCKPGDAWQFWSWYNEDRRIWSPLSQLRSKQSQKLALTHQRPQLAPTKLNVINYPKGTGKIGFMSCPGLATGQNSDLEQDLRALQRWGCATVASLVEGHEFTMLGVPNFTQAVQARNMIWLHLPVRDAQAPSDEFEDKWRQIGPLLHRQLINGSSVVFHCHNGQSRSAMACARLLIEAGLSGAQAVQTVGSKLSDGFDANLEAYLLNQAWTPETNPMAAEA